MGVQAVGAQVKEDEPRTMDYWAWSNAATFWALEAEPGRAGS